MLSPSFTGTIIIMSLFCFNCFVFVINLNFSISLRLYMDGTPPASHVPSDAVLGQYVLIFNLLKQAKRPPFIF